MSERTKILVVDDEEVVRLALARVLSSEHCRVEAAWSGADALREMERHSFDVVLLDLRMPGMDGMSVLKAIKEKWPEIEVIVVTGYPSLETAKEAIRYGAYDYLAKPVEPDTMIKVAHSAVMQKRWSLQRERTAPAPH
jgi:DNA-binding NtrC family response regulator